jgi:hypothetical protein
LEVFVSNAWGKYNSLKHFHAEMQF